jgi:dCMP deaminase
MSLAKQYDGVDFTTISSDNKDMPFQHGGTTKEARTSLEKQKEASSRINSGTTTPAAKRIKLLDDLQPPPECVGITPEPNKCQQCCGDGVHDATATKTALSVAETKELLQREAGYNADQEDVVLKRQDYIDWDTYFMATAVLSSLRSKDPHHRSGCCIVDKRKRIIGIGYNGFPMGASDDVLPWTKPSENVPFLHTYEPYVVHAVINAILCSGDVQGATLFVTEFPTAEGAKAIIQAGISEVVYADSDSSTEDDQKSEKSITASRIMFHMAGVKMRRFVPSTSTPSVELVRTDGLVAPPTLNDKPLHDPLLKSKLDPHRELLKKEAGLLHSNNLKRLDYLYVSN